MHKALVVYIYASMEPEQHYQIKGIKSATAAWSTLRTAYNKLTIGCHICAHDNIDAIEHDSSCPIGIYIQAVTTAFQALINLGETVSDMTIGDHLLCHLDSSYHPVCTSILAQETEPNLAKIKSTLIGSENSKYIIKSKFGNSARLEKDKGNRKTWHEPVTDGF